MSNLKHDIGKNNGFCAQILMSIGSRFCLLSPPDAPVAPVLSLDPQQPVYRYGNNVKLLCTVPFSSFYIREFQYYGDFGLAISIPVVKLQNYSYNLQITGREVSGSYSCAYFVFKSGRAVRSDSSPWVNVYVKREFSIPSTLKPLITTDLSLGNLFCVCLPMNSFVSSVSVSITKWAYCHV